MTLDQIRSSVMTYRFYDPLIKSRKREVLLSRLMFVDIAIREGYIQSEISRYLLQHHTTVLHYLKLLEDQRYLFRGRDLQFLRDGYKKMRFINPKNNTWHRVSFA